MTAAFAKAVVVLIVFALHNAWNCWTFLDFTNFEPAEELLKVGSSDIGVLQTVSWLGILVVVPIPGFVPAKWQRALLVAFSLVNALAPVMRYVGAIHANLPVVAVSSFLQGAAAGVIIVWPPILAAAMWPERQRPVVIAIAGLSNYIGGAAGVALMPVIAASADSLLDMLQAQALVAAPLCALLLAFAWIPPISDGCAQPPGALAEHPLHAQLSADSLAHALRSCARGQTRRDLLVFSLAVGNSLLLQGMVQFVLAGCGFSELQAGMGNAAYQGVAALVGIALCSRVASAEAPPPHGPTGS